MSKTYTESECDFLSKYCTLKLDDFVEELKLNHLFKAVDFLILKGKEIIFVEVKCYDYFKKDKLDENLNKIIKKLSDSYFLIKFLKNKGLDKFKKNLEKSDKIKLVIIICPARELELKPDRREAVKIILNKLKRKVDLLNVLVLLDSENNRLGFFKGIKLNLTLKEGSIFKI